MNSIIQFAPVLPAAGNVSPAAKTAGDGSFGQALQNAQTANSPGWHKAEETNEQSGQGNRQPSGSAEFGKTEVSKKQKQEEKNNSGAADISNVFAAIVVPDVNQTLASAAAVSQNLSTLASGAAQQNPSTVGSTPSAGESAAQSLGSSPAEKNRATAKNFGLAGSEDITSRISAKTSPSDLRGLAASDKVPNLGSNSSDQILSAEAAGPPAPAPPPSEPSANTLTALAVPPPEPPPNSLSDSAPASDQSAATRAVAAVPPPLATPVSTDASVGVRSSSAGKTVAAPPASVNKSSLSDSATSFRRASAAATPTASPEAQPSVHKPTTEPTPIARPGSLLDQARETLKLIPLHFVASAQSTRAAAPTIIPQLNARVGISTAEAPNTLSNKAARADRTTAQTHGSSVPEDVTTTRLHPSAANIDCTASAAAVEQASAIAASDGKQLTSPPQPPASAPVNTGLEINPPAEPTPSPTPVLSNVQVARMSGGLSQSDMQIDLRTQSFGNVQVHAVVRDSQVGLAVTSERGDLQRMLTPELSGLQASFRQHDMRLESVRFVGGSPAVSGGLGGQMNSQSQSHGSEQRPEPRLPYPFGGASARTSAERPKEVHVDRGLNVHA